MYTKAVNRISQGMSTVYARVRRSVCVAKETRKKKEKSPETGRAIDPQSRTYKLSCHRMSGLSDFTCKERSYDEVDHSLGRSQPKRRNRTAIQSGNMLLMFPRPESLQGPSHWRLGVVSSEL